MNNNERFTIYDYRDIEPDALECFTVFDNTIPPLDHTPSEIALGMSEHGLGVSMFCECVRGSHLGAKVKFSDLPEKAQDHIKMRFKNDYTT